MVMESIRKLLDIHVTIVFHFSFFSRHLSECGGAHLSSQHSEGRGGISGVQDQSQLLRGFKANEALSHKTKQK